MIYFAPATGWDYSRGAALIEGGGLPGIVSPRGGKTDHAGRLRLELSPDLVTQVYIDGYFVGTTDDFNAELSLDAGRHRVELRAAGYESLGLDVQIFPGRSTTYRGALKAVEAVRVPVPVATPDAPAPTQLPPRAPATIYFIPGCYLGDVPPREVRLAAGCDASRAVTFKN